MTRTFQFLAATTIVAGFAAVDIGAALAKGPTPAPAISTMRPDFTMRAPRAFRDDLDRGASERRTIKRTTRITARPLAARAPSYPKNPISVTSAGHAEQQVTGTLSFAKPSAPKKPKEEDKDAGAFPWDLWV